MLPLIGITMGDPAGIGPEVAAKAAADPDVRAACVPLLLGDPSRFAASGSPRTLVPVAAPAAARTLPSNAIAVLPCGLVPAGLAWGVPDPVAGQAALHVIDTSIDLALAGVIDGVATAPVNKATIAASGDPFTGHTERFAERTGAAEVAMLLVGGRLRVAHVSTHVPLRQAIDRVRTARILTVARLLHDGLVRLGVATPRLAIAGLNPHAGEGGLFGSEDAEQIAPAVAAIQAAGLDCQGPLPPDTVFWRAARGDFDGVVAMYHDQGHIACKLMGFADGVNITLGLPIVRTSVDHGTAYDIAGRGTADPQSMREAIRIAARLASNPPGSV
ncbi:MAG TPA: 4-hydroxythreonine-4-phosphate dehydrogenase PdxA [Bacillota bacterium]|nr:4-hydroxythreonine-4-phosphate dehydrogenase PdxA [Bacillota bacterium]